MNLCEYCEYCGHYDEQYDENAVSRHEASVKHTCNKILYHYKKNRRQFTGNRKGIILSCSARSSFTQLTDFMDGNIRVMARPNDIVKFSFKILNETNKEKILVVGLDLAHPQPQFVMNDHGMKFGGEPYLLEPKKTVPQEIIVTFSALDIGQYNMTIMFTFQNCVTGDNLIIVRDMIISVEETLTIYQKIRSPYLNKPFESADRFLRSVEQRDNNDVFKVPKPLKRVFAQNLKILDDTSEFERALIIEIQAIFDKGIIRENYITFFHHLLWYEETKARANLRKFNMTKVKLEWHIRNFVLFVPGLAEKRPSLLTGDQVIIRLHGDLTIAFGGNISEIEDNVIHITGLDNEFFATYNSESYYDVRFLMSRVPLERMHSAIHNLFTMRQDGRAFPERNTKIPPVTPITRFYNEQIAGNKEQRSAVEHIVAGTSGTAPYIVFGPPGTGKTMTIVEAIIQLVRKSPSNRILVCTHSNMAADHIACSLLKYIEAVKINNFLLRANSQFRVWDVMPAALGPYSNGTCNKTFTSVSNAKLSTYRVAVVTLLHSAKFATSYAQSKYKLQMTHLFIDEAAQACEPASIVPTTGLLLARGQLVLAGDPKQLGPVCMSRQASQIGLGTSLMERLKNDYPNLYSTEEQSDANYITMLKNNFRSHPDILEIPNELYYNNQLVACSKPDPLSLIDILEPKQPSRGIMFHAVNSKEQKEGKSPSFYNTKEIELVQKYIRTLIQQHHVTPEDIGVVAPYIRQVNKIKSWLQVNGYDTIEVGTVEAFQGKEKRVIIITTVRANSTLLVHDAKYALGFMVDDKRFNVALTRAKAKAIIIGNPACLTRDLKWRMYMDRCRELATYLGYQSEQLERTASILKEMAVTRFNVSRMKTELDKIVTAPKGEKNKNQRKTKKSQARG